MSGVTPEQVRELLDNVKHAQAEYNAAVWRVREDRSGPMVSMTAEQYRWQRLMQQAETRLSQAAPALAQAYLGSEEQLEALTLERDRLAHELRLLREAVGQPVAVVVSEHRRKNAEAVRIVLSSEWQSTRRIWLVSGLNYGTALVALHDAVALGWAERQKPAAKATKAYFRLASLSDDTPERSGSDTFAGGEG